MARSKNEAPPQTTEKKTTTKKATAKKPAAKTQTINPLPVLETYTPSQAEKMCKGISPALRPQALTLAQSILTLQKKIEQQSPTYETEPFVQLVTVGTGETIMRSNPFVQEFRATVREYASTLKAFKELVDAKNKTAESSPLDNLKSRYNIG